MLVFSLLLPGFARGQEQPVLPAAYYGAVMVNGQPAPVGTVIVARIGGETRGQITVKEAGKYGGPGPLDPKLVVSGTAADEGKQVTFEIGGIPASETVAFKAGEVKEINLTARSTPPGPQDTTPPTVVGTDPIDGASGVAVDKTITVTFSEDLEAGDAYDRITVKDATGSAIAVTTRLAGVVLTIKPNAELAYGTRYTVAIPAGAVKDLAGNALAQDYIFSFTTQAAPGGKVEQQIPESGVLENFKPPADVPVVLKGQSGVELEVPPGAFSGEGKVTVKQVDKTELPASDIIGGVFEIKFENVKLDKPIIVRLPAGGIAGGRVRAFKLVGNKWVNLGGELKNGVVEFTVSSFSYFTVANSPAPPTAQPSPGTYTGSVQVTLNAEPGAAIYYSTDGAAPSKLYTGPLTFTTSTVLKALVEKNGLESEIITLSYIISASTGGSSGGGGGGGSGGGSSSGGGGGGVVRPYVSSTDPPDKAIGVPVDKEIKVLFTKTVTAGDDFAKITLKDATGNAVEVDVRIEGGSALYIKPKAALGYGVTYTVVIPAGAVKDEEGYSLSSDYTFTFTTVAEQPKPPVAKFKDMAGHWAADTVSRLAYMGVISGYEDGTFRPDNEISRAEVTAILVRALRLPAGSEQDLKFRDKASIPDWAKGVVAAAAREGLVRGYPQPDGTVTFEPDRPVSRAEMAALVVRILDKKIGPVVPAELKFADAGSIPDWARSSVGAAVAKGIVVGYPDNTFRPDNRVTRAEAAAMILRLLDAIGSK